MTSTMAAAAAAAAGLFEPCENDVEETGDDSGLNEDTSPVSLSKVQSTTQHCSVMVL